MDESPVQLQHKYEKKSSDPLPNLGSSKEKKKNPVYIKGPWEKWTQEKTKEHHWLWVLQVQEKKRGGGRKIRHLP